MTTPSDQASIRRVIAQERETVKRCAAALKAETRNPYRVRLRALQAYHRLQIKRWKEELRG